MYKNFLMVSLIAIMVIALDFAAAPVKAEAQGVGKIGILNLQEAINKSKKGQAAKAQLVSKFEKLQKELKSREAEIEKMQQDLDRQTSMLSAEAKFEKEKSLKRSMRDFQDKYADYTQEMKKEEFEATKPIISGLVKIAGEYGKEQGYTLILEAQKAGVVYAPDAVDITEDVVKRFDSSR